MNEVVYHNGLMPNCILPSDDALWGFGTIRPSKFASSEMCDAYWMVRKWNLTWDITYQGGVDAPSPWVGSFDFPANKVWEAAWDFDTQAPIWPEEPDPWPAAGQMVCPRGTELGYYDSYGRLIVIRIYSPDASQAPVQDPNNTNDFWPYITVEFNMDEYDGDVSVGRLRSLSISPTTTPSGVVCSVQTNDRTNALSLYATATLNASGSVLLSDLERFDDPPEPEPTP